MKVRLQPNEDAGAPMETWVIALSVILGTYPILFTIDRANVSGFVIAAILGGLYFWQKGSIHRSSLCWAIAAGIKITPVAFALFFLNQRRYKAFAFCLGWMALVSVAAAAIYKIAIYPAYSPDLFREGLKLYVDGYAIGGAGLGFGASLYGALKLALIGLTHSDDMSLIRENFIWLSIPGQIFSVILVLSFLREPIDSPQVLLDRLMLTMTWLLLAPHVMASYYLALLLIPLAYILVECQNHRHARLYAILIALVLIPKTYKWMYVQNNWVSSEVWLNPMLLLALWVRATLNIFRVPGRWIVPGLAKAP